jgi:hypothetical protein
MRLLLLVCLVLLAPVADAAAAWRRPVDAPVAGAAAAWGRPVDARVAGAAAAWRLPVDAPVVGRFHIGANPFAAGQRRGVDLAVSHGARVVAPCSGRVAFTGRVPRFGLGVSVRCGRLTATVLGLARASVRAGASVRRGAVVGAARGGRLRLGARVTAERFGYLDPMGLLGAGGPARTPLVGPRSAPRRLPPPLLPPATPRPSTVPKAGPSDAGARTIAWVGLALIACALPGGALAWRVRRARVPLARVRRSQPR